MPAKKGRRQTFGCAVCKNIVSKAPTVGERHVCTFCLERLELLYCYSCDGMNRLRWKDSTSNGWCWKCLPSAVPSAR